LLVPLQRTAAGGTSFLVNAAALGGDFVANRKDYVWNKTLDQGGFLLGDDVKVVINLEAAKKK